MLFRPLQLRLGLKKQLVDAQLELKWGESDFGPLNGQTCLLIMAMRHPCLPNSPLVILSWEQLERPPKPNGFHPSSQQVTAEDKPGPKT